MKTMHPDQLQNTMQRTPGRRFAFALIFFTALIDSIGFGIILPVIPELLMDVSNTPLDTSAVYGGGLMFVYAIMQFFFAPVLGNLSDAYGRRPVLLVSLFVLGVNYFIMGLAPTLTLLFVGRVISGIGAATYSTCNAYVADITSTEERAQYFGHDGRGFSGWGLLSARYWVACWENSDPGYPSLRPARWSLSICYWGFSCCRNRLSPKIGGLLNQPEPTPLAHSARCASSGWSLASWG